MADGPCGEDFKAAFSCFVYSEAEPKGVDCVEKFKAMQDCFRLHPDVYGEGTCPELPLQMTLCRMRGSAAVVRTCLCFGIRSANGWYGGEYCYLPSEN